MHYFAIRGHYSMNMLFAHDLLPLFHIINCTVGYINMSFTESCRWTKSLYAHDHAWITSLCLIHEKAVQSMSLLIERWHLCLCFFFYFIYFFITLMTGLMKVWDECLYGWRSETTTDTYRLIPGKIQPSSSSEPLPVP